MRFVRVYFDAIWSAVSNIAQGPAPRLLNGHQPPTVLSAVFLTLNLVGLAGMLRFAAARRNALILLGQLGFILSIPFVWQDGGLRVIAATIPFAMITSTYGTSILGLFFEGGGWGAICRLLRGDGSSLMALEVRTLIVPMSAWLGLMVLPLLAVGTRKNLDAHPAEIVSDAQCPLGSYHLNVTAGRFLYAMRVHESGSAHESLFDITKRDLVGTLARMHLTHFFQNLPAPYTMFGIVIQAAGPTMGYPFRPEAERMVVHVVWPNALRHFDKRSGWSLCVELYPHEVTGYNGPIFKVTGKL